MMRKLLLIDFENIQNFDLSRLGDNVDVVVFLGLGQKIPPALNAAAGKLGNRLKWLKMGGAGPNALDFHIACHLGRVLETAKGYACYVLSNDKGFDPLLKYLNKQGLAACRIGDLSPLDCAWSAEDEAHYKKVAVTLRKRPKPERPRTRSALITFIAEISAKKIGAPQVNAVIARLINAKLISLQGDKVSYG